MAPGAVRQEPRQGRDQLGWLEQVPNQFLPGEYIWTWLLPGGDVPQGDVGASSSFVPWSSSHGEEADGNCH